MNQFNLAEILKRQRLTPDAQETPTSPPVAGLLCRRSVSIAEQVRAFNPAKQRLVIEDLPRISIQGKNYVHEDWVCRPSNAKRYSWIGAHGLYLVEMNGNQRVNTFWSCSECDRMGRRQTVRYRHD
jgi:hypothetical protein